MLMELLLPFSHLNTPEALLLCSQLKTSHFALLIVNKVIASLLLFSYVKMVSAPLTDKMTLYAFRRTSCHHVLLVVLFIWWLFSGLTRPDEGL